MKKQIFKAISLRLLLASSLLAAGTAASASGFSDHLVRQSFGADSLQAINPEVSYIGSNDDFYFFELRVSNPGGNKMEIVLTDKPTKIILYNDYFSAQAYVRKVAVPRENIQLQWTIINKSTKGETAPRTYQLSSEVKLKDEVKVTKL
jgi:hypothetical protein